MRGYVGKILECDLTNCRISTLEVGEEFAKRWIGGVGWGVKLLFDRLEPELDPLDPPNDLMFLLGPLTGTGVPTSGRHSVVGRSPLTGAWGECDMGGKWGAELRRAGYDGIIIRGRASVPSYIWVSNRSVEIRNAEHLWGKDTYETTLVLSRELGEQARIQCVGPAGERLIYLSCIMDGDGRAAGRGGLGAVMGSKLLKAIAVRATNREVAVACPDELRRFIRRKAKEIATKMVSAREYGTSGDVMYYETIGDMPKKNWTVGEWEGAEKISGERLAETILTGRYYCDSCVIGCGRKIRIESGPYAGVEGAGPEYEAVASLGAMCLIDDLEAIAAANELCNRYGMDVISVGSVAAFAMEAYENGALRRDSYGVPDLRWGSAKGLIDTIHLMGQRRGLGEVLGRGVKRASRELGLGSEEYALEVRGLELPMHDPRAVSSLAVAYATNPRGACHRGQSHYLEEAAFPELGYEECLDRLETAGKGIATAKMQDYSGLFNCLKLCNFIVSCISPSEVVEALNLVTGWGLSLPEYLKTGERIFNLKRLYNCACGLSRKDDTLPGRILEEPLKTGGAAGFLPPLEPMLEEYYRFRGWGSDGMPTNDKCHELGLMWERQRLYALISDR